MRPLRPGGKHLFSRQDPKDAKRDRQAKFMKIEALNKALPEEAEKKFLDCCGSTRWAHSMSLARPFADLSSLLSKAEQLWKNLEPEDWLEAFSAHPKIGSKKKAKSQGRRSADWSGKEQSGMKTASENVRADLAEANVSYEEKFGYIFIVCATGKSALEMLDLCRQRLNNDPEQELRIAAEEQQKITEIRLKKLINN